MNEKLLQYLWNFKIFKNFDFKDTEGNSLEILDFGTWNLNSGPDFLEAKIRINRLIFVGNIELHVKSSDWIFHGHSDDKSYDHLILHVVYKNDVDIEDLTRKNIPTLVLENHIDENLIKKYSALHQENQFIPCEKLFDDSKIPFMFHEETILKKLAEKTTLIEADLKKTKNDFEAVLFTHLSYAFGLKVNAPIFKELAENTDFSIIKKISQNVTQLEALLFGKSGWLNNPQDDTMKTWKREFEFLKSKFDISDVSFSPKFLRMRPQNFPTIRLSQLANLYHKYPNLFSKIIAAKNAQELYSIFENISASDYWINHFNFGKPSTAEGKKVLTKDFIELLVLNAILPIKYCYTVYHNEEAADEIITFYRSISAEKNTIIKDWKILGAKVATALESQSLIYHYKTSCQTKNCLNCSIGFQLLKQE